MTTGAPRISRLTAIGHAFGRLAPEDVAFEVADVGAHVIHVLEAALIQRAVEKRRHEFATGRWCAAHALARVGAPAGPVLRGAFHQPLWPSGFAGSITHHGGVAAAAACAVRADGPAGIGIDLADCSDLKPYRSVLSLTCCAGDDLGSVRMTEPIAAAYVFSIKEAAVKCLSPILCTFIELSDLAIRPAGSGCHVVHQGRGPRVFARSTQVDDFIVTFASVDAS